MGHCCSASDDRRRRYVGVDEETPPQMRRRERRGGRGGGGGGGGGGGAGGGGGGRGAGGRRGRGGRRGARGGQGGQENTVPFPFLAKLFASRQRNVNDVPIIVFDVNDGEPRYKAVMDALKVRQCALAPDVIGHNVPICPFPNPETGASHFIIRLTNRREPRFKVDLLIRDTDLYFIGFRRHRILSEDERAAAQAHRVQINEGPGIWYKFENETLPACLNTEGVNLEMGSGHRGDSTTPGGRSALEQIFITLSLYEDQGANKKALRKAVQRVMVTFCEATRLRSVYQEIAKRIRLDEPGSELSDRLWKLIHCWQVLSAKALQLRLRGQMGLDAQLPADLDDLHLYGFDPEIHTVASLIGPEGELMLLNRDEDNLIEDYVLEERMRQEGSSLVEDPNFSGHVHEEAGEVDE